MKNFNCLESIRALIDKNPDSIYKVKIGVFVRTLKVHLNNLLYVFSNSLGTITSELAIRELHLKLTSYQNTCDDKLLEHM